MSCCVVTDLTDGEVTRPPHCHCYCGCRSEDLDDPGDRKCEACKVEGHA